MKNDCEIIASDLHFPEGPVALEDGSVLFVEIAAGRLSRWRPDGRVHAVATPGGGPNGAAIGPDGSCYVCNNGGMAWQRHGSGRRSGLPVTGVTALSSRPHKRGGVG